jgi:hypothetical protein
LGKVKTALEVTQLAEADWQVKYKTVLPITMKNSKTLFDQLGNIRRDIRNYSAHGSFGTDGEAFAFHSNAGAVPVLLPHRAGSRKFRLKRGNALSFKEIFEVFDSFENFLWQGGRGLAKMYIQEAGLPLILPFVDDGTYAKAMSSAEEMEHLVEYLSEEQARNWNMDY